MSEKDLCLELLEITEVEEGGKVDFSDRAKEILFDLAAGYKESEIYKQSVKKMPEWIKTATAAEVYIQMCDRITQAPTVMHMMSAIEILVPIIWEKLQEEEGVKYFKKTSAVGTTQHFLEEMEKLV